MEGDANALPLPRAALSPSPRLSARRPSPSSSPPSTPASPRRWPRPPESGRGQAALRDRRRDGQARRLPLAGAVKGVAALAAGAPLERSCSLFCGGASRPGRSASGGSGAAALRKEQRSSKRERRAAARVACQAAFAAAAKLAALRVQAVSALLDVPDFDRASPLARAGIAARAAADGGWIAEADNSALSPSSSSSPPAVRAAAAALVAALGSASKAGSRGAASAAALLARLAAEGQRETRRTGGQQQQQPVVALAAAGGRRAARRPPARAGLELLESAVRAAAAPGARRPSRTPSPAPPPPASPSRRRAAPTGPKSPPWRGSGRAGGGGHPQVAAEAAERNGDAGARDPGGGGGQAMTQRLRPRLLIVVVAAPSSVPDRVDRRHHGGDARRAQSHRPLAAPLPAELQSAGLSALLAWLAGAPAPPALDPSLLAPLARAAIDASLSPHHAVQGGAGGGRGVAGAPAGACRALREVEAEALNSANEGAAAPRPAPLRQHPAAAAAARASGCSRTSTRGSRRRLASASAAVAAAAARRRPGADDCTTNENNADGAAAAAAAAARLLLPLDPAPTDTVFEPGSSGLLPRLLARRHSQRREGLPRARRRPCSRGSSSQAGSTTPTPAFVPPRGRCSRPRRVPPRGPPASQTSSSKPQNCSSTSGERCGRNPGCSGSSPPWPGSGSGRWLAALLPAALPALVDTRDGRGIAALAERLGLADSAALLRQHGHLVVAKVLYEGTADSRDFEAFMAFFEKHATASSSSSAGCGRR